MVKKSPFTLSLKDKCLNKAVGLGRVRLIGGSAQLWELHIIFIRCPYGG